MPKYNVALWFAFAVDYEVEAESEAEAKAEAHFLNDKESDLDLAAHANQAIEVVDTIVTLIP